MSRMLAVERASLADDPSSVRRQFVMAIGWALAVLFSALALVLLVRRLGGAFDRPLGGLAIAFAALLTEMAAWLVRRLVLSTQYLVHSTRHLSGPQQRRLSQIFFLLPGLMAAALLASLTLRGTPVVGIIIAWLFVIAGEAAQGVFQFRPELWRHWITQPAALSAATLNAAAEEAEIPAGLVQQVTRVREGERESLHALVRADIAGGDRLAVLHLSFCPPLAEAPELTAHAVDAENVEVRVTQAEMFGARIEVRLPREEAEPRGVMVEVLGTVTSRQGA